MDIDTQRDQKLKFIEILFIVGGIVASLNIENLKNSNSSSHFGFFLMLSLIYYFTISNSNSPYSVKNSDVVFIAFVLISAAIAYLFSKLVFSFFMGGLLEEITFLSAAFMIFLNLVPFWLLPQKWKSILKL